MTEKEVLLTADTEYLLQEQLKEKGMELIAAEEDMNRGRISGTMLQRYIEILEVLGCVYARTQPFCAGGSRKQPGRVVKILMNPIVSVILSVAGLAGTVISVQTGEWIHTVVILSLLIGQSILRLVMEPSGKDKMPLPDSDVVIDTERAQLILDRVVSKLDTDAESISNMFSMQHLDRDLETENEIIRIYASLYEARLDNPDADDFSYAVSLTGLLLQNMGFKLVEYSEADKKLFNVELADYHDEMRCPAIINEKTGELVHKGYYIKNNHSRKLLERRN